MKTSEERREILEMVANGKISASEGAALLSEAPAAEDAAPDKAEAITIEKSVAVASPEIEVGPKSSRGRWMNIRVDDLSSGKDKVRVRIPLGLVKFGLRMGRGFAPELGEFDLEELSHTLQDGESGMLIDVVDEADGKHVQIYVD